MAKPCIFCTHKDRKKLEIALLKKKKSQGEVASILGISQGRISEHLSKHLKKDVREAIIKKESIESGLNVTKQLMEINKVARVIIKDALEAGDGRLTLRAVERVEKQLELQAKLLGDIPSGTQVQIIQSPQFVEFKTLILGVLDDWPEVKVKVIEKLRGYLNEGTD